MLVRLCLCVSLCIRALTIEDVQDEGSGSTEPAQTLNPNILGHAYFIHLQGGDHGGRTGRAQRQHRASADPGP